MITERIDVNFSRSAIVRTKGMEWRQSPVPEISRKRLELVGEAEAGRVPPAPVAVFRVHPVGFLRILRFKGIDERTLMLIRTLEPL